MALVLYKVLFILILIYILLLFIYMYFLLLSYKLMHFLSFLTKKECFLFSYQDFS